MLDYAPRKLIPGRYFDIVYIFATTAGKYCTFYSSLWPTVLTEPRLNILAECTAENKAGGNTDVHAG